MAYEKILWRNGYDSTWRDLHVDNLFIIDMGLSAGVDWDDEYIQPPAADDAFEVGGVARPMDLALGLLVGNADRGDYQAAKANLLKWLNPRFCDPANPGRLRRICQGVTRDRWCRPVALPRFVERQNETNMSRVALRFRAYDPAWFDPAQKSVTLSNEDMESGVEGLVFGDGGAVAGTAIFGTADYLQFGYSYIDLTIGASEGLTTLGDWPVFPTIVVTGPGSSFEIYSNTTGERLRLSGYTIAAGETVTFDLAPGKKSVTSSVNDDVRGYVPPGDELGTLHLEVDPIASGGINSWDVDMQDVTADSEIAIIWYDRYSGI